MLLARCPFPPAAVRWWWCFSAPPAAAAAGAKKVYAVEATDMAQFAKKLVAAQGLDGVVEVIQGVVESVVIPEKVDIIISEWMVRACACAGVATCHTCRSHSCPGCFFLLPLSHVCCALAGQCCFIRGGSGGGGAGNMAAVLGAGPASLHLAYPSAAAAAAVTATQGYFLLRESMLDSVLAARDKYLKPDGALYPSHARMFVAPIRSSQW